MVANILNFPGKRKAVIADELSLEVACQFCCGVFHKKESDTLCEYCRKPGPFIEATDIYRQEFNKNIAQYKEMQEYATVVTPLAV